MEHSAISSRRAVLLAAAALAWSGGTVAGADEQDGVRRTLAAMENVRVMHVGDSNTAPITSYRQNLFRKMNNLHGLVLSNVGYWYEGRRSNCPTRPDTMTPCVQARPGATALEMIGWTRDRTLWPDHFDPRLVFVMAGTNDVDRGASAGEVVARLGSLVKHIAARHPAATVFLSEIPPIYSARGLDKTAENAKVVEVNGQLPELLNTLLAEGYDVHWEPVGTYDALTAGGDVATRYGVGDNYHFNAAGHGVIGNAFYHALLTSWWAGPSLVLYPGDWVSSPNGLYVFVYQHDGNLVLYRWDGVPLWHSATHGQSAGQVWMRADGNLVVYDADWQAVWSSNTWLRNWRGRLAVQDDGNVVIYGYDGRPRWATNTAQP